MGRKPGVIILVIGLGVLVLSALADVIGIGDQTVFGPMQTLGTTLGVLIAAFGLLVTLRKKKSED